jgi:hypothetical protein
LSGTGAVSFYGSANIETVVAMGTSSYSFFADAIVENLQLTGTGSAFTMEVSIPSFRP